MKLRAFYRVGLVFIILCGSVTSILSQSVKTMDRGTTYGAPDAKSGWRIIVPDNDSIQFLAPSSVEIQDADYPGAGASFKARIYTSYSSLGVFQVISLPLDSNSTLPKDFKKVIVELMETFLKLEMKKINATLAVIGPTKYKGMEGKEYLVDVEGVSGKVRILEGRIGLIYQMAIPNLGGDASVNHFLNSLDILK